MLENVNHIASIVGQVVAVLIAVAVPIFRLYSRVQKLEAIVEQHEKAGVATLGERLARIETLLEVLIGERKPNA